MGSALPSPADKDDLISACLEQLHEGDLAGALVRKRARDLCELCHEAAARVYCPADEAKLCLGCDRAVHSANFLVSRHRRELLCRSIGAPCGAWAFTGGGIDEYDRRRHCTLRPVGSGSGDGDRSELLSATTSESGSSSCCTESRSSEHGEGAAVARPQRKRLHVAALDVEEGCGDSDDPRHPTPVPSERTRFASSRTGSHARPLYTATASFEPSEGTPLKDWFPRLSSQFTC